MTVTDWCLAFGCGAVAAAASFAAIRLGRWLDQR